MGAHSAPRASGVAARRALTAVLVGAALVVSTIAITGVPAAFVDALAPPGVITCADLATQADAQALLDADPTEPHGLDPDRDGRACDELYGDDVIVPPSDDPVTVVEHGEPDESDVTAK